MRYGNRRAQESDRGKIEYRDHAAGTACVLGYEGEGKMIADPIIKVTTKDSVILETTLWTEILLRVFEGTFVLKPGTEIEVYLNNEQVERPLFEDDEEMEG